VNKKGFFFSIDIIFSLIIFTLFLLLFYYPSITEEKLTDLLVFDLSLKTNDLLLTSQILEIKESSILKYNFQQLFSNYNGYIKINNKTEQIKNTDLKKENLFVNSIKYINSSNNDIYIEIGIYY
jgi:hypothetical protein